MLFLALCECHVLFFWSLLVVLSSASDGYLTHLLWLLLCWILKHNPVCRSLEFLLCDSLVSSTLLTSGFWTLSSLFFSRVQNVGSTWAPTLCAEARNSQEAGLTRRLTLLVSHQSGMIVLYCLMLSILKIPVSYVLHFVCFRWEDTWFLYSASGSGIPYPVCVWLFHSYQYLLCVRLYVEEKAHRAMSPTSDLTGSPHPCPHPLFLFIYLAWQVLAEACGV